MPEGDSVWKLARRLDRQLTGRTVVRSDFRVPRLATRDVAGRGVLGHDTHGKHLLTRLPRGSGPVTLHSHLRMDGSGRRPGRASGCRAAAPRLPAGPRPDLGPPSTASAARPRLVATADEHRLVGHLGPDPLRADWDPAEAVRRLSSADGPGLVARCSTSG